MQFTYSQSTSECQTTADFNNWQQAGYPDYGNWQIIGGGDSLYQSINGNGPTFYITAFDLINVEVRGKIVVDNDGDNDYIGFVFGFKYPMSSPWEHYKFWLFDWKKENQDDALEGFSLDYVDSIYPVGSTELNNAFWSHNEPGFTIYQTHYGANTGWDYNTVYELRLIYTTNKIITIVDNDTIFEQDGCFEPGRFGFYNYSQSKVTYFNFSYNLIVNFHILNPVICSGDTVHFVFLDNTCYINPDSLNINSIVWDFGDGDTLVINHLTTENVNPSHIYSQPGTYTVSMIVTDNQGCVDTAQQTITVNSLPEIALSSDTSICSGDQIQLNATGGISYFWNTGDTTSSITVSPETSTTFFVTVVDENSCENNGSVNITVNELPTVSLGNDTVLCPNQTITLNAGSNYASYFWSTSETTHSIVVSTSGIYSVTVTNDAGCENSDTISVSNYPEMNVNIIGDTLVCENTCNNELNVSVSGGGSNYSYLWNTGDTTSVLSAGCTTMTYFVTVTDNNSGCFVTDSLLVEVDNVSTTLQVDSISCNGLCDGKINLTVQSNYPPYHYVWSNSANTSEVDSLCAGSYIVTVTDSVGCSIEDTIVLFDPLPLNVHIAGYDGGVVCPNDTLHLGTHVSGGHSPYTYYWNSVQGGSSFILTGDLNFVNLRVVDDNNCESSDSLTVTHPLPLSLTLDASKDTFCMGDDVLINANVSGSGGLPYYFTNQSGEYVNFPFNINLYHDTIIIANVNDDCVLPASDTLHLYVYQTPPIFFNVDTPSGCEPLIVTFNISEGASNVDNPIWNFGDNDQNNLSLEMNPSHTYYESGTYDVTLYFTSNQGCKDSITEEGIVTVYPKPHAEFTANPSVATIVNSTVDFINLSEGNYLNFWSFGTGDSSIKGNPRYTYPQVANSYEVVLIIQSSFGCKDTAKSIVEIQDVPVFYAPTAFTPDGDGINEFFYVIARNIDTSKEFYLGVYDRWGELIWSTNKYDPKNPSKYGWDGSVKGGSNKAIPNVYVWRCVYHTKDGNSHVETGKVVLIR